MGEVYRARDSNLNRDVAITRTCGEACSATPAGVVRATNFYGDSTVGAGIDRQLANRGQTLLAHFAMPAAVAIMTRLTQLKLTPFE